MFGTFGKLFQSSIFSACKIFKLGPQSKLPEAENIVSESTKFRWSDVKELIEIWKKIKNTESFKIYSPNSITNLF